MAQKIILAEIEVPIVNGGQKVIYLQNIPISSYFLHNFFIKLHYVEL